MKATPAQRASIVASSLARGHALMGTEPAAKPADKPRRDPPGAWGLAKLSPAQADRVAADLQALADSMPRRKGSPTARTTSTATARTATATPARAVGFGRPRPTGCKMTLDQKDALTAATWAKINARAAR
jgi:hypothetical protein